MSERTSQQTKSSYSVSIPVFTSVLKGKNPRREWWLDSVSLLRKIAQSLQIASFYCCRTTSLADDQLSFKKYHVFSVLKRIGPFGVFGPRYRHAAGLAQALIILYSHEEVISHLCNHALCRPYRLVRSLFCFKPSKHILYQMGQPVLFQALGENKIVILS